MAEIWQIKSVAYCIDGLAQDCGISSASFSNGDTALLHWAIDM